MKRPAALISAFLVFTSMLLGSGTHPALAAITSCSPSARAVSVPQNDPASSLRAVAQVAPNDVWAVGDSRSHSYDVSSFVERWNGTSWSLVTMPPGITHFGGVTGLSSSDVWVGGNQFPSTNAERFLHWNGSTWKVFSG